jgi:serine-type D-Ala-D-Ala carboxypeptidase/endopeptidase (penicillin-binding protein 4)
MTARIIQPRCLIVNRDHLRNMTASSHSRVAPTIRRTLIFSLSVWLTLAPVAARQAAPSQAAPPPSTLAELQSRLAALLDQPKFAAARLGALVVAPQTGESSEFGVRSSEPRVASRTPHSSRVVFERDAGKLFTPASNMKLYTSAAALDALGPDFRLKTSVYVGGRLSGGEVRGDLILYGRGDPNLSARFDRDATGQPNPIDEFTPADRIAAIESLADQIKARGVKRVVGNVVGDDSYFATEGLGAGWGWEDLQYYYGAEVSALTVNDNAVTFTVRPAARAGQPPVIAVQPQTSYMTVINRATTVGRAEARGRETRVGVNRPMNGNAVEFFGTMPLGAAEFKVNVAVHDPANFAATLLKEALARRGVRVTGRVKRMDAVARLAQPFDETKLTEVASVMSEPLSVMLKVVNKPSQNLHTELLLRQLGVRAAQNDEGSAASAAGAAGNGVELDDYGRPQSAESRGIEALRRFLAKAGVDAARLSLRDGSGLSRQDLISPRATAQLLLFMHAHPHAAVFRDSLPVAGVDGTLSNRMRGTPAASNVRAKTGSLSHVRSLAGYVTTKRGQTLVFSLMGNNYTGAGGDVTGLYDEICALLAGHEGEL